MEFYIEKKCRGASVELTCTICISRSRSKENSDYINSRKVDINGLAYVQISSKNNYSRIQAKIMSQKLSNSSVRIKLICEDFGYHTERICSELEYWEEMPGSMSISDSCIRNHYIFVFIVTVFACVAETPVLDVLYKEADFTDFRLSTTEGSVPVHKACLASRSDVFKKMLSHEWKETGEGSMQLPGVTLQTLRDFKQYLYLGTLPNDGFLPLLELASCYMIKDLKEMCLSKLAWKVKPEEYYSLLQYSMDNNIPELTFALIQTTPPGVVEDARRINVKENVDDEAEAQ